MPNLKVFSHRGHFFSLGFVSATLIAACSADAISGSSMSSADGGTMTAPDAACVTAVIPVKARPLDMFIMLDQSGSMSETVPGGQRKWDAVTGALKTFIMQPGLGDFSVGIQYFGLSVGTQCTMTTCKTDSDCGLPTCGPCISGLCFGAASAGDSCNAADYAKADVEIAPLPGVAPAVIQSLNRHGPLTATPTSAALQGAINHAKLQAQGHPDHNVIVLFATDGDPSECDTNLKDINAIAAAGFNSSPKIPTLVIGVGTSLSSLNGIAAAGGTNSAFIVDPATPNVDKQFLEALNQSYARLGCQYQIPIPSTGMPDFGKVNVVYTKGGGTPAELHNYMNQAACPPNQDGWYYDNSATPTQILLCPATCSTVSADSGAGIDVVFGCPTQTSG